MKAISLLICVLVLSAGLHAADPAEPVFKAGAAISDVTAPLGSSMNSGFHDREATCIHNPQLARCLALGGYETWRARSSYLEVEASTKMPHVLDEMLRELSR